uniref:F-box protein CPR1-like n=1 Tax=Erigeron canadensis TaxID=72917 RepID=UPI001CB8DF66|nr:F-box protein CPR1-like [Erigeron canadensis]
MSSLSASTLWHPRKKPLLVRGTNIIPDDVLLSNIFIRLAAKQLAQMRSLSKTWNSRLSHPSFIKSHLDHSKDTNDEILMVFQNSYISEITPFTTHTTPDLQLTNSVNVHMNSSSAYGHFVGAVNGLICLFSNGVFKIWNPSLSSLIALPPYTFDSDEDDITFNHRFGFDPKTNDYKVIKLTYNSSVDDNIAYNWFPVEVFSVLKGSWESITERFPSHVETILNMNEFVVDGYDGRLHYLCRVNYGAERKKVTIVAFDLGDETFSEIVLPDSVQNYSRAMEVGVLSKKLCVMSGLRNGGCEVWVMENYGVVTSWVKCHVISKYKGHDIYPIGFTSNNQFLFAHGIHLSLYDPEASTFRDFKDAQPFTNLVTVVQYVDSLVWVTAAKWAYNDVSKSSSQIEKKQHLLDG